jgi:hypothetical protein
VLIAMALLHRAALVVADEMTGTSNLLAAVPQYEPA